MLFRNDAASLQLDVVNYELPAGEGDPTSDDRNWLVLRCTWIDEEGDITKDSNSCLLTYELQEMTAGESASLPQSSACMTAEESSRAHASEDEFRSDSARASDGTVFRSARTSSGAPGCVPPSAPPQEARTQTEMAASIMRKRCITHKDNNFATQRTIRGRCSEIYGFPQEISIFARFII